MNKKKLLGRLMTDGKMTDGKMTVKEFADKYIRSVRFKKDAIALDKYADTVPLAYAHAGGAGMYVSVLIFNSARKLMVFLNGERVDSDVRYHPERGQWVRSPSLDRVRQAIAMMKDINADVQLPVDVEKDIERRVMLNEI